MVAMTPVNQWSEVTRNYVWSPPFQLWIFLLGCLLALAYSRPAGLQPQPFMNELSQSRRRREALLALSVLGLLVLALVLPTGAAVFNILLVLPFLGLIAALVSGHTALGALLRSKLAVLLGEASYSLYIVHYLPVTVATFVFGANPSPGGAPWWLPAAGAETGSTLGVGRAVALMVATVFASLGFYRWLELPARRWLRRRGPAVPRVVVGSARTLPETS